MDSKKMLFACVFVLMTLPFAILTSKAAEMITHIEKEMQAHTFQG